MTNKCCYKCTTRLITPINCHDYCKLYKAEQKKVEVARVKRLAEVEINEFRRKIFVKEQKRANR